MSTTLEAASYSIQHFPATLLPFETHGLAFKLSNLLTWLLWLTYVIAQFHIARTLQQSSTQSTWRVWIIALAELFLTFADAMTAINLILGLFSSKQTGPRPEYRLVGDTAPRVDVLVTSCGESIPVILDTLAAASSQEYPAECLHVFLLDDGRDEELRHAVAALNNRHGDTSRAPITYLSREKVPGVRSYFKSGNLRFGIEESQRRTNAEFIAGLDADMIPERAWLAQMVPHLLLDEKLALACPSQVL